MPTLTKLTGLLTAAITVAGATAAGTGGLAQASARPAASALAGSVAPFTSRTPSVGDVAASTRLTIQLWLKPNIAAAQQYAAAISTPGSPLFRHYLSPAAYATRFGASRGSAAAVQAWLRSRGFTAVRADAQRDYVRASAPVKTIDAALHTQLRLYRPTSQVNAGPYALRANDRPVSLPAVVAGRVLGVTGLDNAAPVLPLDRYSSAKKPAVPCSSYYGQHQVSGLPKQFGTTTFPTYLCGYSAGQLRDAYGARGASAGTGQTIALVELGLSPGMFRTLRDYAAANHMPAPSTERYAQISLGTNNCDDPFYIEEQLDVEASYDMAPGAHQLVVSGNDCNFGDFGLQGLFDADTTILNGFDGHPLATVASNSWGSGDEGQPPILTRIEHAYLVRAADEGVGMYFAAGDSSGVFAPASDPYSIAVGGTTLGIGKAGNRLFETGWSSSVSPDLHNRWVLAYEQGASGGGPSVLWKEPGYQKGVVPPALTKPVVGNRGGPVRSVPDISADGDLFTGMAVGLLVSAGPGVPPEYIQMPVGGTSLATPLVAGMVTAAQQGQRRAFGFIDPLLYKLAGTDAVHGTLPLTSSSPALDRGVLCPPFFCARQIALGTFDVQSYRMLGYSGQVTLPGYDNMTGVGTPNGPDFIAALRKLAS